MDEPEHVVKIIREVGCSELGNWDGCCCSNFSIRNVDVEISCGKGREQAVRISSHHLDYSSSDWGDQLSLQPIMDEVLRQLREQSGRGDNWAQYFHSWEASTPPITQ